MLAVTPQGDGRARPGSILGRPGTTGGSMRLAAERTTLTCRSCNQKKPVDLFPPKRRRCRACAAQVTAEWRQKHPERHKANVERWRVNNPERRLELQRRWLKSNRKIATENGRRWKQLNPERAHVMEVAATRVRSAIRKGVLSRPACCEQCGTTGAIEAAHYDYTRPLDVRWLCRRCHRAWDQAEPKTRST
jgi:ribosomal protein S27AE